MLEPVTGVNPGCWGGWAAVVTVNGDVTPPMFTIVEEDAL
jgi:hypothetical protein